MSTALNPEPASRCETCRFWRELKNGDENGGGSMDDYNYAVTEGGTGVCRRFPPRGLRRPVDFGGDSMDAASAAHWPVTWAEDWCGEYAARLQVVDRAA